MNDLKVSQIFLIAADINVNAALLRGLDVFMLQVGAPDASRVEILEKLSAALGVMSPSERVALASREADQIARAYAQLLPAVLNFRHVVADVISQAPVESSGIGHNSGFDRAML